MLSDLLTLPITIVRISLTGDEDIYGDSIPTESTLEIFGELQQRQRAEPPGEGELSASEWLLVLPAGTDIDTNDAVIADGQRFEVTGAPWPARNPRTGAESHIEATLRRVATAGAGS